MNVFSKGKLCKSKEKSSDRLGTLFLAHLSFKCLDRFYLLAWNPSLQNNTEEGRRKDSSSLNQLAPICKVIS